VLVEPVAATGEVRVWGISTASPEHATPTTTRRASTANTRREGIGAHTKHDAARNDNPTVNNADRCHKRGVRPRPSADVLDRSPR